MKAYQMPLLIVKEYQSATNIFTVSTEDGWKDEWDDNLADTDTTEASDEA